MSSTYRQDNASAEGIVQVDARVGQPAIAANVHLVNSGPASEGNVIPATNYSTAPYKPPKRRHHDNPDKVLCSQEGCTAWPRTDVPYCTTHALKHGVIKGCGHRDCSAPPKKGTGYCRWHQPEVTDESE